MHQVIIPGYGADGATCPEGDHQDLGDHGESLSKELPATPKQPLVGFVGPDREGEEQVEYVRFSVLVETEERKLR